MLANRGGSLHTGEGTRSGSSQYYLQHSEDVTSHEPSSTVSRVAVKINTFDIVE